MTTCDLLQYLKHKETKQSNKSTGRDEILRPFTSHITFFLRLQHAGAHHDWRMLHCDGPSTQLNISQQHAFTLIRGPRPRVCPISWCCYPRSSSHQIATWDPTNPPYPTSNEMRFQNSWEIRKSVFQQQHLRLGIINDQLLRHSHGVSWLMTDFSWILSFCNTYRNGSLMYELNSFGLYKSLVGSIFIAVCKTSGPMLCSLLTLCLQS